jgi:site-specific recombinase XerD
MAENAKNSMIPGGYRLDEVGHTSRVAIPFTSEDAEDLAELRQQAVPDNTARAYRNDWARFSEWCATRGGDPVTATPENVATYLAGLRKEYLLYSSIARAAAGIQGELKKNDPATWLSQPWQVKAVLKDLRKNIGVAPRFQKKAMSIELLERGIAAAYPGDSIRETRNRSILTLGYYIATRRLELAQLQFAGLDTSKLADKGLGVAIRRSKSDQEGRITQKWVHWQRNARYCPVQCLLDWVRRGKLVKEGLAPRDAYVFRELTHTQRILDGPMNAVAVARAVKEVAAAIGLDPADYGAHSLRVGFVTDAAGKGYSLEWIANQTGHRSLEQLRKYIRRMTPWEQNATEGFYDRRHGGGDEEEDGDDEE